MEKNWTKILNSDYVVGAQQFCVLKQSYLVKNDSASLLIRALIFCAQLATDSIDDTE